MKQMSAKEINQMPPDEYARLFETSGEFRRMVDNIDFSPSQTRTSEPAPELSVQRAPGFFQNGQYVEYPEPQTSGNNGPYTSSFADAAQRERDFIANSWDRTKRLPTLPQE